jgi:hypothetical protein
MINVSKFPVPTLDRLSTVIPLAEFIQLDIRKPALVRVMVDSYVAKSMLALNVKNRRQRRAAVDYLKHQIRTGEWRDDHPQPVIFSDSGRLIDGQHRLQAIAEMDIGPGNALMMRVETGARDDVREYLDTGVPRTLDDRVELVADHLHNKVISQICTWSNGARNASRKRPSPEDAKEFFVEHAEALVFVAQNHKRERGTGKIQIAFAAMEYYERDKQMAMEFYPALFVVDSDVQQARVLRDYCQRMIGTTRSAENTSSMRLDLYLRAVSAMKAHSQGRKVTILRKSEW